jgi:hypothetical protein
MPPVQPGPKGQPLKKGCIVALIGSLLAFSACGAVVCVAAWKAAKDPRRTTASNAATRSVAAPNRRLSPGEQKALVEAAMAEYAKPTKDCAKVIRDLSLGLPDDVSLASEPAFMALAECARLQRRWWLMREATVRIMKTDRAFARAWYLPRADIGLGRYEQALADLDGLLAKSPKDPELVFTKGLAYCKEMRWPECGATMDETMRFAHLTNLPPPRAFTDGSAALLRSDADLHLGRLDEAQRFVEIAGKDGADGEEVAGLRKDLVRARSAKVVVDEFHQLEIPLGIYHLYGHVKDAGSPAALFLSNIAAADRQFRVEAEIVGLTSRLAKDVTVLKGKSELVSLSPALKPDFNIAAQRSTTSSQIAYKITALDPGGEKVVYEDSHPVEILPRDFLLLSLRVDEVATRPFDEYIGAWVTPNAKAVEAFITEAKKRAPKETFSGPQSATIPQVRAMFDELKSRGVSYVMDPEAISVTGHAQRTRLPSEVLSSSNAQCLEGAILFATLMENIGLDPFIVLIPGHALAGWLSAKDGMPDGTALYVETTMVHSAEFDDAMAYASSEVLQQKELQHFDHGLARYVVVSKLRRIGVGPQPGD